MRALTIWALLLLLALSGCRRETQPTPSPAPWSGRVRGGVRPPLPAAKAAVRPVPAPHSPATPTNRVAIPPRPLVVPVIRCEGTVVFVNPQSRFVVIDFSFNPLPRPEQRLGLYRDGNRVGEVRVSSAAQASFVAADVLSGDAQLQDEARED